MLVLEPMKRYTIEQIKNHRWMATEPYSAPSAAADPARSPAHVTHHAQEPNEQVLRLMQSLGIDPVKTKESLRSNSYDHHAAIYLLLLERLRARAGDRRGRGPGGEAREGGASEPRPPPPPARRPPPAGDHPPDLTVHRLHHILKQSSEDCRRLLRRSTAVGPEVDGPADCRLLTSSSFDSKCTVDGGRGVSATDRGVVANFLQNSASATNFSVECARPPGSATFAVCSEAAKLMDTLRESPLPLKGAINLSAGPMPSRFADAKLSCVPERRKPLESTRPVSQRRDPSAPQTSTPPFRDYASPRHPSLSYLQSAVVPSDANFSISSTTNDLFPTSLYRPDSKFSLNRYTTGQTYGHVLPANATEPTKFQQQYSSSTDEGCETDMEDVPPATGGVQNRLSSYASSSSSSGVVTFYNNKSLSQNLSCDSSQSNFSAFESIDYQLSNCSSELAGSLPSCTSNEDKVTYENSSLVNTSPMHPCVYISSYNNKNGGTGFIARHNPVNYQTANKNCARAVTRSPVDFREGRRASDGLVAQQVAQSSDTQTITLAFNSQKLNENCKAKGVLELHLVQKEAQKLKTQYQSSLPAEEMTQRQIQHNQFAASFTPHYLDTKNPTPKRISLPESFNYSSTSPPMPASPKMASALQDTSDSSHGASPSQASKPPLQQQLLQHRLFQQKRQLLQKQMTPPNVTVHEMGSLHGLQVGLSRRQMLRQQSYKIAQQQQILPPLPLIENENRDLPAFRALVEDPSRTKSRDDSREEKFTYRGSMDISIHGDGSGNENWSNLPSSLQSACQISGGDGAEGGGWGASGAGLGAGQWAPPPFQAQACFQVFQQIN